MELMEELRNYFADLLIIQYRGAERNRNLIKFLVDLIFANNLAMQVKENTVSLNSVGKQLDVVGKWVGIDRFYSQELWNRTYLSFPLYSTIKDASYSQYQGGFSSYSTFDDNDGGVLTYKGWQAVRGNVNSLGDEYFIKLIQLKIIKNSIRSTCKAIDDAIWSWSEGNVYTTWGKLVYEASNFNIVGTPTITSDGIASGFSTSNYLTISLSDTWDKNTNFTIHVLFTTPSAWGTTGGRFWSHGSNNTIGHTTAGKLSGSFLGHSINNTDLTALDLSTEYEAYYIKNNTGFYVKYRKTGETTWITSTPRAVTSNSTVSLTTQQIGKEVGSGFPFLGSIDLKAFSITVNEQKVFSGASEEPMHLTYHYTNDYKNIIEIAKLKNALPKPSGCNIILEGI